MQPHPAQRAIFVFGSNLAGIHGAGAALTARRDYGAKIGVGSGPTGQSYAIPTKATPDGPPLPLEQIQLLVSAFLWYAAEHPTTPFLVTRIGCGLAGYSDEQIAPLFDGAPANVLLPGLWLRRHDPGLARLIVAGSRSICDAGAVASAIDRMAAQLRGLPRFEVVSGMAHGVDTLAAQWAQQQGVPVAAFPAEWDRLGKRAGFARNATMAWYSTHLLALWDGQSRGTKHMIDTARRDSLAVLRAPASHNAPIRGFAGLPQ